MVLGLSTFTFIHTILSIVALLSGIVVMLGLLGSRGMPALTALYLLTAVVTSATGFGFQTGTFGASKWVGVISLVALLMAIVARYVLHFAGAWRWIYAVGVVLGVYFLVFVAIAQAFMKIPALHAMAPTLSEPPFAVAQLVALAVFVGLAILAAIKFHPAGATN
jgi:hypothetical protein